MLNGKKDYFLVDKRVLPEVFIKTMEVKEILKKGKANTIQEAVEMVGISRSAYYKYKDAIMPFYEVSKGQIITISLLLEHTSGVLSKILNQIATAKGSILTINQSIPLHGIANATISFETKEMERDIENLFYQLLDIDGVKKIDIVGKE